MLGSAAARPGAGGTNPAAGGVVGALDAPLPMLALAFLSLAFATAPPPVASDTVLVDAPDLLGTWVYVGSGRPGSDVVTPSARPHRVTYGANGVMRYEVEPEGTVVEVAYRVAEVGGERVMLPETIHAWAPATPFSIEGERLVLRHPAQVSPPDSNGIIRCGVPTPAYNGVWERLP